jgi:PTH1 family peptidyl-tRNA hydrolase
VFHDELDLAPFKVKVKAGRRHRRAKRAALGRPVPRPRVPPRAARHRPSGHKDRVTGYVLGNYAKAEIDELTGMLAAVSAEAAWLAQGRGRPLHER